MAQAERAGWSFAGFVVASAGCGALGGVTLAAALLASDCFGLATLMQAAHGAPAAMILFAAGLGVLLAPVGFGTGLALLPPHASGGEAPVPASRQM